VEVGRSDGQDHELLHGELVSSMTAAVDHVKGLKTGRTQKDIHVNGCGTAAATQLLRVYRTGLRHHYDITTAC